MLYVMTELSHEQLTKLQDFDMKAWKLFFLFYVH